MYILKIKGKAKIPDYIQLRDDNFTLKAYFRVDRPDKSLSKFGYEDEKLKKLMDIINELPFGKVMKIDI
ncbi:MAG: fructose-6-phosphate aldolase [Bacteroidia bacterium]|nr:fructose-6-phosphate aldolase [Bacteroidia bacterium]MCZ2247952.1 fructose-6-phosphate aldolase [Bacteroidia bacterium]